MKERKLIFYYYIDTDCKLSYKLIEVKKFKNIIDAKNFLNNRWGYLDVKR